MSSVIGVGFFPATQNGGFACKCRIQASLVPVAGRLYHTLGINRQLKIPGNFLKNADAMLSITSAYTAAVQGAVISNSTPLFLTLDPPGLPNVTGASEGIATLLAFMGCVMDEHTMITGYVDAIGMTESYEDLLSLPVRQIDEVKAKAIGAEKCGLKLFIPADNVGDFGGKLPSHVIPVATVRELVEKIKA